MKTKMNSAKDIFLNAARQGRAVHIGVHLDVIFHNDLKTFPDVRRSFNNAQKIGDALLGKTTSLWTSMVPPFAISNMDERLENGDQYAQSRKFSAINNRFHQRYLREQNTQAALITGVSAPLCVSTTRNSCLKINIAPIMVIDAIDIAIGAERLNWLNRGAAKAQAKNLWGEDCLTATTKEVISWVAEI